MNSELTQNIRYKLQKRVRRVNSVGRFIFPSTLKQFWAYLQGSPILWGILADLEHRVPDAEKTAQRIMDEHSAQVGSTEVESAAIAYFVLRRCVTAERDSMWHQVGRLYERSGDLDDVLERFREVFVEPVYEYLDEQLDDQRAILDLLRRYKQRCEWFQRARLYELWKQNQASGERTLALDLYEWLHDQGLDFVIEPSSVSGEADLVAAQRSDDPLIADAKIFDVDSSRGTQYIAKGFHQLYTYTCDFNAPFGYLVIYKTCAVDLRLALSAQVGRVPFVTHNNKTIFLVVIDIHPHETSASKRGVLGVTEITESDLIHTQLDKPRQPGVTQGTE